MKKLTFKEYKSFDFVKIEKDILLKWESKKTFQKSTELREDSESFVFYEGPPSANGMPGIHHVISRTIKDMFCRYKTLKGYQVSRKAGWDTHGLPVELTVENKLGITKKDIGRKVSVEQYNKVCREEVLKYKTQWDELTKMMGYWVDLDNPYVTFDNNYIESVWWSLATLYKKKMLYKNITIQPYSPAAGTGLSSHELNQPGTYKPVKDTSIVALFELICDVKSTFLFDKIDGLHLYVMTWTTTPWTLPSNLALAVHRSINYLLIKTINPYLKTPIAIIIAEDLCYKYFKEEGQGKFVDEQSDKQLPWEVVGKMKGEDLLDLRYKQLFPLEASRKDCIGGDAFKIIHSNHVTIEDGTGIVHMAPAFGADDFKACKQNGIGFLCLVDREGKFVEGMNNWSGKYVKNYKGDEKFDDVNIDICVHLKKNGHAFLIEKYVHTYPHCWRTDKPVLYYPLDAWFVNTSKHIDQLVALNKTINWKPASTGEGRFGNWLLSAMDWNLSRSRFWGTPLPIWRTEDKLEEICIGSIDELTKHYLESVEQGVMPASFEVIDGRIQIDLHKPYIDQIILVSPSGKPMFRETDLIDVWYDSGAMSFAQWHYPFENKFIFEQQFPADFICEGVDQTRGWFYTLHVLGVLLFGQVAYKNVVSNGLVLDKQGNKMSKRSGNVVDPYSTIKTYGADATRWYLVTNSSPWDNMKFDLGGIKDIQRKLYSTFYNTFNFFAMYANVDGFTYEQARIPIEKRTELDRWIYSALQSLVDRYSIYMDNYEPMHAHRLILDFVNEYLSNWYVRLSRRRFWKGEYSLDKIAALQTLYECLETLSQLMASLSPFFAEWLFYNLNSVTQRMDIDSVHHSLLKPSDKVYIDKELESKIGLAKDICSLALSIRKQQKIKVRQPLRQLFVSILNPELSKYLHSVEGIIKQEVNVKEVLKLDINSGIIKKEAKAKFAILGKKYGQKMPLISEAISNLSHKKITIIETEGKIELQLKDNTSIQILKGEIDILTKEIEGWSTVSKENYTVALDIYIDEGLLHEGYTREFVNKIQNIRKKLDMNLTDKIKLQVQKNDFILSFITKYNHYICSEVLASNLEWVSHIDSDCAHHISIGNQNIIVNIIKI